MKIGIDCGHTLTGADTGAEGCGRKEQECTREIGYKLKTKLEALGHEVIMCQCDSCSSLNESLSHRVNVANNFNADLFVCIHLNAANGLAHGTEVYTYKGKELAYARNVLNEICNDFGFTNRGIKGANLYVVNHTNMPAMLIECCFIDNVNDMAKYDAEKFANAICRGITGTGSNATTSYKTPQPQVLRNDWIARLQAECNKQGFSNQLIDGVPGSNTLKGCPLLRKGAIGNITKLLQEKLNSLGYNTNGVDGIFGNGTFNAVIQFQRNNGLGADGVVGENTWSKLLGLS